LEYLFIFSTRDRFYYNVEWMLDATFEYLMTAHSRLDEMKSPKAIKMV